MSTTPNSPLIKNLIDYGLSDKEAKIYLALLELEIAPVQEVAKVAGINRSSAYVVLESLKKQGLVSVSEDKKVQQYIAASPETLLSVVSDQARKQEEIKEKISEIVPELKALYKGTKQKPKIQVFEGKNGVIAAFEDTFDNKEKTMRVVSSAVNLMKIIPDYIGIYAQKRIEKGIKMKGIHPKNKTCLDVLNLMPSTDDSVVIPESDYAFNAELAIYDDKIGYTSAEDGGFSIIIQNKGIADVMKSLYDLAFKQAKSLDSQTSKKKK